MLHRRAPRIAALAIGAALAVFGAAGCTAVSGQLEAQRALTAAGYDDVSVRYRPTAERDLLDVTYRTTATDSEALTREYRRAAEIVWTQVPIRFDAVRVRATNDPPLCVADCRREWDRTDLEQLFGPRDPSLDKDIERQVLVGAGVVIFAIGFAIAAIVVVVTRRRRRRMPVATPFPPGWGPPGPPPWDGHPAYGGPPVYSGPPMPPPVPEARPWDQPQPAPAPPLPEPDHDIWERPPS